MRLFNKTSAAKIIAAITISMVWSTTVQAGFNVSSINCSELKRIVEQRGTVYLSLGRRANAVFVAHVGLCFFESGQPLWKTITAADGRCNLLSCRQVRDPG